MHLTHRRESAPVAKLAIAFQQRRGSSRREVDQVPFKALFAEHRARFERSQCGALRLRQTKLGLNQRVCDQSLIDRCEKPRQPRFRQSLDSNPDRSIPSNAR